MTATLLTDWAWLLFDSYRQAGVQDVIISPGARSLPFALAAINQQGLRCHVAVDERTAGFFALGQARITGRPSITLCTSGSAAAHLFPAVVEAAADHLPLIVLTADRPRELHDCGAAQSMDQLKLFGAHVRRFFEVGSPHQSDDAFRALRRIAAQSVFASRHPEPGPVHLNLAARKPLEPMSVRTEPERELRDRLNLLAQSPLVRAEPPRVLADRDALLAASQLVATHPKGLLVCGPLSARVDLREAIEGLAQASGYPLLAEATSQLRFRPAEDRPGVVACESFDRLLASPSFCERNQPDVVIQIGAPPVASQWERFSSSCGARFLTLSEHGWHDPSSLSQHMIVGDLGFTLRTLTEQLRAVDRPRDTPAAARWAQAFRQANDTAWQVIDDDLRAAPHLTEGAVARQTVASLPPGSLLFLGNSLPIRLVDTYSRTAAADVRVLCQRGVNGIDGAIAGAAGTSTVAQRPLFLLIGDLTFLHDLGALAMFTPAPPVPVVMVVIQNDGGRIFEQLPVHAVAQEHQRRFIFTPQGRPLEPAAQLFGVRFRQARTLPELREALASAAATTGLTIIEAVVPPHGAALDLQRLTARVQAALQEKR